MSVPGDGISEHDSGADSRQSVATRQLAAGTAPTPRTTHLWRQIRVSLTTGGSVVEMQRILCVQLALIRHSVLRFIWVCSTTEPGVWQFVGEGREHRRENRTYRNRRPFMGAVRASLARSPSFLVPSPETNELGIVRDAISCWPTWGLSCLHSSVFS